jgi:hypothetical protein
MEKLKEKVIILNFGGCVKDGKEGKDGKDADFIQTPQILELEYEESDFNF